MPTKKPPTIPKLPRGLGSMSLTKNNTIEYKKCIHLKDGSRWQNIHILPYLV